MITICSAAIDWAASGSWFQGWATWAGAAAVIYAAHKGASAFETWRRQKQEERRIDVAERCLTLAYRIRREVAAIRNMLHFNHELNRAREKLGIADKPQGTDEARVTAQVVVDRLHARQDLWDQLFATMPSCKAYFGDEAEGQLDDFWKVALKIQQGAHGYSRGGEHERVAKYEAIIWAGDFDDEDAIAARVDTAVARLEAIMLPVIRADYAPPPKRDVMTSSPSIPPETIAPAPTPPDS